MGGGGWAVSKLTGALPDKSEPFGLAFEATNSYVSDSSDDGGITRFHMVTSECVMIVENGTPLCQTVHSVDVTKDGHLIFTDRGSHMLQTLSQGGSTSIEMAKEDKTILRDWRDNFGKPVRQLTGRNKSTKDNVGTLPIFAYATPDPPQQPLNFFTMVDQTPRLARTESIAPSGAACTTILFQANTVFILKRDHIRRQSGVAASGPFFIGTLEIDITENDHESYFDLQLSVPSFQDCLNFIYHGKVNVHRDEVICTVNET